ncbi:uncharacterized protein LOC133034626 [Cannabis sativa]|nr:uncharacterized protein LOC133034626 [Cannabis sativa]KAF4369975.1 hypothetical protein G4B88_016136 [Cannabis sativa]KAF4388681.1 hypothetical protein G4B88_018958 [Cannabis sativa]
MLRNGAEIPSRCELLSIVKKNSKLLGKTVVVDDHDGDEHHDVELDSGFWHDVMDFYFFGGKEESNKEDDLVFFVKKLNSQGHGVSEDLKDGSSSPYFVRRWGPKLDDMVGDNAIDGVDWRRSFYLNLIAHTSFSVTVAICSHQDLLKYQAASRNAPLSPPVYKVVKTVYASPSRVNFHLDSNKEVETTPAYPDICFAIDDFDSTFDAVVLTELDHCYCVLLNAQGGAAFPSEHEQNDCGGSSDTRNGNTKITLFSGFVSYPMVRDAYYASKSRFGSLLAAFGSPAGKSDRIYMKGPGGRGEVEVAVSGPFSPVISKRGYGIGSIVRKAATAAAAAVAASHTSLDEEMVPLKCCLMSISLPWEHIVNDLLFKETPPVNL